ncbi:PadR family transcriptional regulator [Streptomyces sp. NPDC058471]|uniref:PadR family transcriptional regulator n=1 Tax=Streptomyces sp. NPDC058471 TaxID=3346516 RepID=UPI0036498216
MAVLEGLLAAKPDAPAWGLSICRDADLGPGTVYPILDRLLERGWLKSWDETDPHPGRPARRFYEFTGAGRAQALEALEARIARRARFSLHPTGGAV